MSVEIQRQKADVCGEILTNELNDFYGGTPVVEGIVIDDNFDLRIFYDVTPSAQNLTDLDTLLAAHDCSGIDDLSQATESASIFNVLNNTVSDIDILTAVYITGFDLTANIPIIAPSNASNPATMPAIGMVHKNKIKAGETGFIIYGGPVHNIDTSAMIIGTDLYVTPGGGMVTSTKPIGTNAVQKISQVIRVDALNGIIQVYGAGRANDLPNLTQNKGWIGDVNGVPQEADIYIKTEVDNLITASDQNLFETIVSDSGNTVANTTTDTLNIVGGTGISTAIVGDTLTVTNDTAGGGLIGSIFELEFVLSGSSTDIWMFHNTFTASNEVHAVVPFGCELVGLTYSNKEMNSQVGVEVRAANAGSTNVDTLRFDWILNNVRVARKTNGLSGATFNAGDKIGIFLDNHGGPPGDPVVMVYLKVTDDTTGESSENYSGFF